MQFLYNNAFISNFNYFTFDLFTKNKIFQHFQATIYFWHGIIIWFVSHGYAWLDLCNKRKLVSLILRPNVRRLEAEHQTKPEHQKMAKVQQNQTLN